MSGLVYSVLSYTTSNVPLEFVEKESQVEWAGLLRPRFQSEGELPSWVNIVCRLLCFATDSLVEDSFAFRTTDV